MIENRDRRFSDAMQGAVNLGTRKETDMFKILENKGVDSAPAMEVGRGYSTRAAALAAVKSHLKTFKASGHNPEGDYWWARDAEGLRKCWISAID
jgi:hypothetical protein